MDADDVQTMTLEAFADTIIPGERRSPGDRAIAGATAGPGAVQAGALDLLRTPATGVTAGLGPLSAALNAHAATYAAELALELDDEVPSFVSLSYEHRTRLITRLVAPGHPEKDGWVLLSMFSYMAYDSAAHIHTADAIAAGHPGLLAMGFAKPDEDGLWRSPEHSYRRALARPHPNTTPSGSPA
jgi:enediyne biosynthesis protein E8